MHEIKSDGNFSTGSSSSHTVEKPAPIQSEIAGAYTELERGVYYALETYSNVHRGSGHKSMASIYLFEKARDIVLEYLGLDKNRYMVIFCTPRRAAVFTAKLDSGSYQVLSSQDIGLSIGIRALAIDKEAIPGGAPFQTGGGTTRLISRDWVIWAHPPEKFEAGTPAIINIITFARALRLMSHYGKEIFRIGSTEIKTASEILYHDELEGYSGQRLLDELKLNLIGQNISVPTLEGPRPFTNLDFAASTPTFTPVWKVFYRSWNLPGQVQEEIIHEVKAICADLLGAPLADYDVIFTSNTTEAINLAAESLSRESEPETATIILNTILEHTSNELPWRMISHFSMIRLKIDDDGILDLKEMDRILSEYNQEGLHGRKRIKLVAVSGASNVLGVFNNLQTISQIVHRYGARLLVDAAQLVAHRKVEMGKWGIDYLAFSAHKVYAPFGSGALMVRKGMLNFSAAELELIQASGEENTGGIAALGKALVLLQRIGLELIQKEEQDLTGKILRGLVGIPDLKIYGIQDPDSPRFAQKGGVIVFSLERIYADRIAKELAEQGGIGVRYGCHCAHLLVKHLVNISPFLERFQGLMLKLLPGITPPGLTRVSIGIGTNEEDIETCIRTMSKIAWKGRTKVHRDSGSEHNEATVLSKTEVRQQINDFVRTVAQSVYD